MTANNNMSVKELDEYKKLKYDEVSNLLRFYRDMLEVYGDNSLKAKAEHINYKLTEFQNIFVNHMINSVDKSTVDTYVKILKQFIANLFNQSTREYSFYRYCDESFSLFVDTICTA